VGLDSRIGTKYFDAGIGYGGSCFPKDVQALLKMAEAAGHDFEMLRPVIETNREQPIRFMDKVKLALGDLRGLELAVLGLSFKPGTDDMRSAPSIPIIRYLLREGASVRAYDPQAVQAARRQLGDGPVYTDVLEQAAAGCDACIIVTDWPEIAAMDLARLRGWMRKPVVFDGRNLFSPAVMREAGFDYYSVGRPAVSAGR
jgi:UDPglucose 6-dehydrogenase